MISAAAGELGHEQTVEYVNIYPMRWDTGTKS